MASADGEVLDPDHEVLLDEAATMSRALGIFEAATSLLNARLEVPSEPLRIEGDIASDRTSRWTLDAAREVRLRATATRVRLGIGQSDLWEIIG